jgi:hypothetical protein
MLGLPTLGRSTCCGNGTGDAIENEQRESPDRGEVKRKGLSKSVCSKAFEIGGKGLS